MPDRGSLGGLRALVIEDDYLIACALRSTLKEHGAEIVRLSGAIEDAMAKIREGDFAVVLLDIDIRGTFAFSLADELVRRKVPFAFVSGHDRRVVPPRFDAVPYWRKPYEDRQIVGGIGALWRRSMIA